MIPGDNVPANPDAGTPASPGDGYSKASGANAPTIPGDADPATSDAHVPGILDDDEPSNPGDASLGSGWHLGILLDFVSPCFSSPRTWRGFCPRCSLGERFVEGILDVLIEPRTDGHVMTYTRRDPDYKAPPRANQQVRPGA